MRAFLAAMMIALVVGFAGCQPKEEAAGGEEAAPAAEAPAEGN